MSPASSFYTLKEVASLLGVSMTTVYIYVKRRKNGLPVKRFGRNCIRVPKDQFHKWAGLAEGES